MTFVVVCELFHDSRLEVRDFLERRSMVLRETRETAGSSIRNEVIEVWNLATPFMTVCVKFKKVFKVELFGIDSKILIRIKNWLVDGGVIIQCQG